MLTMLVYLIPMLANMDLYQSCPPTFELTALRVFAAAIDEGELRLGYVLDKELVPDDQLGQRRKHCLDIEDPPVHDALTVTFDKPLVYRGQQVGAHANLTAVPGILDLRGHGKHRDLFFRPEPDIKGINTVALSLSALDFAAGRYTVTLAWPLESGTFLSATACLEIDTANDYAELCADVM